jgi:hypothetical protein
LLHEVRADWRRSNRSNPSRATACADRSQKVVCSGIQCATLLLSHVSLRSVTAYEGTIYRAASHGATSCRGEPPGFAPVPMAWQIDTGADGARLNTQGGAIAVGHPPSTRQVRF